MPTFRYQKGYDWTRHFINYELWRLPRRKPKVYRVFSKYCGLKDKYVKIAFQTGYVPDIEVKPIGTYGYAPPTGDRIQLGKTFIDELEAAMKWKKPGIREINAPTERESNLMLLLETTILHEMVHYFRRTNTESGAMNASSVQGVSREEGIAQMFEREAYGRFNTVHSLRPCQVYAEDSGTHEGVNCGSSEQRQHAPSLI